MKENITYTVNTLYLVNGDTIDAIQNKNCPLGEQIIYQFEHPRRDFISINHDDIGTVSVPIKNIVYITANHMSYNELYKYLDNEEVSYGN